MLKTVSLTIGTIICVLKIMTIPFDPNLSLQRLIINTVSMIALLRNYPVLAYFARLRIFDLILNFCPSLIENQSHYTIPLHTLQMRNLIDVFF